jgi:signal transduction histidine kinase
MASTASSTRQLTSSVFLEAGERSTCHPAAPKHVVPENDRNIGVLAHDLRNPLFAIVAGLDVLDASKNLSEEERGIVARMFRSARRMTTMIRDVLDHARISLAAFPHDPVPTDLRIVCQVAIDELRSIHPGRQIACEVAGDVEGSWDPVRLQQVVSNLVGNALEHSAGVVSVRVEAGEHDVVLSVHNDGDPIPPHVLPVLFEPFGRGDRSPNGLGLGLYIVREIIRRHSGTIEVHSSPAVGTTFVSRWPRHAAPSRHLQSPELREMSGAAPSR